MIRAEQLRFRYPGSEAATLHGLDFDVREGEIFGFLGPSGAGKSTTQKILTRLLSGYHGTLEVMGRPLAEWDRSYHARVGVSFELPNHYGKLSARENLAYFRALYAGPTESPEAVMELVGLSEHLDKPVAAFSKGMKIRLNVARSLLCKPQLWFLDEPTSGLDPVNALEIRKLVLAKRAEGVTVLLTTHDMHVAAALCDRVAFIVDGRLIECDRPSSLTRRYGRREVAVTHGSSEAPVTDTFPLDGIGDNPDFLRTLRASTPLSIHSQETTLEDVFVQVTGRGLR